MTTRQENIAACARATGEEVKEHNGYFFFVGPRYSADQRNQHYNPYEDWSQCGPLVEKLRLDVWGSRVDDSEPALWYVKQNWNSVRQDIKPVENLKAAICDCVAAMQLAKEGK